MQDKKIRQLFQKIQEVKIQGATEISLAILSGMRDYGLRQREKNTQKWQEKIEAVGSYLLSARSTEPLAQNGVRFVLNTLKHQSKKDLVARKKSLVTVVDHFIALDKSAHQSIQIFGQTVLAERKNILTHCHSSTVEGVFREARKGNKKFKVFNTETRPLFQGRITAKNLLEYGIPVTMITDSAAPFFASSFSGDDYAMDLFIIGADAILKDGGAVNKTGSFGISLAASQNNVPVYIASSLLKFYPYCRIEIEQRKKEEVWANAPAELEIINPSFDYIPASQITGFITEAGIIRPLAVEATVKQIYPWMSKNQN